MSPNVLITGATGFLGSQLTEDLLTRGYRVAALVRDSSDNWRIQHFKEQIEFINVDTNNWQSEVYRFRPEVYLHLAWEGVGAKDRDNLHVQYRNLQLLVLLLEIAGETGCRKFLGFGSQAEYGVFSGTVTETHPIQPTSAYGLAKQQCAEVLRFWGTQRNTLWYWLRLFSFFGEKEDSGWLIPSVVSNLLQRKEMDMTPGEQRYAYMYVGDLSKVIISVIEKPVAAGIYNISSKVSHSLRSVVEELQRIIGNEKALVHFGALPYRQNQPMHIQGDVTKLENEIGCITESDFGESLKAVVEYLKCKTELK